MSSTTDGHGGLDLPGATRPGSGHTGEGSHAEAPEDHAALERRVHVDLPRIRPEDMVTTQDVDVPPDPEGGRDTERDFMLRYAGGVL